MSREPLIERLLDRTPRENLRRLARKLARRPGLAEFDDAHPCVFVLSTGRVGSKTLAALLGLAPNLWAVHEPEPKLFRLARRYYEASAAEPSRERSIDEIFGEVVLALREPAFRLALAAGVGYAETGPQATFLAPAIGRVIPKARFVHLVRDPRHVVRSAVRRGWYGGVPLDANRIVPPPGTAAAREWASYDLLRRNAWLWTETNRWIREFCATLPDERWLRLPSEALFAAEPAAIESLFRFVAAPPPPRRRIEAVLGRRLNRQLAGDFPAPEKWPEEQRRALESIAGALARDLGYRLD